MTIAVGLVCKDGIVICADRQMTAPEAYKYYEDKTQILEGEGWTVAVGYAGYPRVMKEAMEKIDEALHQIPNEDITIARVCQTVADLLSEMGPLYEAPRQLWLLLAVTTFREHPQLFVFNSQTLDKAESENLNCIGVGDSALIRFLFSSLYLPEINNTKFGLNLGIYLVKQAKEYIDGCGGGTTALVLQGYRRWEPWDEVSTQEAEKQMNDNATEMLKKFAVEVLGRGNQ